MHFVDLDLVLILNVSTFIGLNLLMSEVTRLVKVYSSMTGIFAYLQYREKFGKRRPNYFAFFKLRRRKTTFKK